MKKFSILALIIASVGLFLSCDKIPEDQYLKDDASVWFGRKILVLDFTGHKCGNCPKGHRALSEIEEKYGEALVPVAVHCTFYGNVMRNVSPHTTDSTFNYDFRCEEGITLGGDDQSTGDLDLDAVPAALVNSFDVAHLNQSPNSWISDFAKYYSTYPEYNIEIGTSYADSSINADIKVKPLVNGVSHKLKLAVYVIEDGIVGSQLDYEKPAGQQEIPNYVHNHVLRSSFSGVYGEEIAINGDEFEKSYSKAIKADWNVENCQVIAFVYDADTKEMLQAEIKKVVE
mgnify:FL=1